MVSVVFAEAEIDSIELVAADVVVVELGCPSTGHLC